MPLFQDPAPFSRRRWAIFIFGTLNFIVSMFYRVSVAVISPSLVRDLNLDTSQLGNLSASFFYGFAICQLPLGLAIDRVGARISAIFLGCVAVTGGIIFALGPSYEYLLLGRFLLGVGLGGNLMIILVLLAEWFSPDRFASLGASVVAIGVLGNLFAATPLVLMNELIGWRACFLVFTLLDGAVVTLFVLIMRDHPPNHVRTSSKKTNLFWRLKKLFGMYGYWAISFGNFVRYGYFVALQGLWATPFLIYGLRLNERAAADALLFLGFGYMFGLPFFGYLSDKVLKSRKKVIITTFLLSVVLTFSVCFWSQRVESWVILSTFFGMGMFAAPGQISYAHIKELVPPDISAQAMTAMNLFNILGAALITQILGMFAGGKITELQNVQDFRFIWLVGASLLTVAATLYCFVPESPIFGGQRKMT
ncbi:MAG: MFS transporter [Desulfomonilaceae bacterium]